MSTSTPSLSEAPVVFSITLCRAIWRVTQDGAFYGDYRSQRHATASMHAAAGALREAGRVVQIAQPKN